METKIHTYAGVKSFLATFVAFLGVLELSFRYVKKQKIYGFVSIPKEWAVENVFFAVYDVYKAYKANENINHSGVSSTRSADGE